MKLIRLLGFLSENGLRRHLIYLFRCWVGVFILVTISNWSNLENFPGGVTLHTIKRRPEILLIFQ
jgi:hypothetical protein